MKLANEVKDETKEIKTGLSSGVCSGYNYVSDKITNFQYAIAEYKLRREITCQKAEMMPKPLEMTNTERAYNNLLIRQHQPNIYDRGHMNSMKYTFF